MVISFRFDEVEVSDAGRSSSNVKVFTIPGLSFNYLDDLPLLPILTLPLSLSEGHHSVTVDVQEAENFPGVFPPLFKDRPNDPRLANPPKVVRRKGGAVYAQTRAQAFTRKYPGAIAELEPMGVFREFQMFALRVYPIQVTGNGVRFYKKFRVRIALAGNASSFASIPAEESRLLRSFLGNPESMTPAVARSGQGGVSTQWGSSQYLGGVGYQNRVRIIVDENGIYQVTGRDLEQAGISLADIDPGTLRLTNKGQEVAFYLVGDQDNRFDPEDYFEFWGERNERTFLDQYPDQYQDPFSDENVYWLEWGGTPGVRMVEENGSLVATRPGEYNPSFFYSTTVHVEKDNHFERLGKGSEEQLSYTRDLWFFDSGVKAVGKKPYPFELEYPDPSSFRPVEVTVMFSGKSFGATFNDGDPNTDDRIPHNVMVWLNNGFVGSSKPDWFDQDTSRISNRGNSTLRNSDLVHGTNILEVQLPSFPMVTVLADTNGDGILEEIVTQGTDIVLLNWFEVTYDRLYRAHNNQIEFRRPAFIPYTHTDLFQFDIDNFTRPDIEVYKKGISKIVNFPIQVETINGVDFYKISFQDNVPTDDIEYIALTGDRKKKPLRIEPDEPFDPLNPERTLHDRTNVAEYVIITHPRFYDSARRLLEHRRNQGVAAELISVQDIYDEFNYGIKSPLAIRDFLRYAFFNWQRNPRLKYVLLLGDANFDYKSRKTTAIDFVPTFFYQTQGFGAAATDFPYSHIAGDDIIPDLFVGRIPATSNSDVNNAISKIIEYEESPPQGTWRNRALFISGNDRNTYELGGQLGYTNPAFRSQNSRVIESLVPRHVSSIRLNTIADPNLPVDPNFGTSIDLLRHWDNGLFLINFMGHGGGGIWADVQLMDLPDVDKLSNKGMYPFVTSMTCFTGAFENPNNLGLAQKLVLVPDKGAIGVFASSGLGYLHNDYAMLWNVGQYLFDRSLTIGEIVTLGKILYWFNGGIYTVQGTNYSTPGFGSVRHEMVYQYNLIGDPILRLRFAEEGLVLRPSTVTPQRGEVVSVRIETTLGDAEGYVELVDKDFTIVDHAPVFTSAGQPISVQLTIPQDFPEGTGLIRAYLNDGSRDAAGKVAIGVNHAVLTGVEFSPKNPDVDDTVSVILRVEDVNGVERVYLFRQNSQDSIFAQRDPNDSQKYVAQMPPSFRLGPVFFDVFVENRVGNVSAFRSLKYVVTDVRPDIAVLPNSLRFVGPRKARLMVSLENLAGAGADGQVNVQVEFFNGEQNFQTGNAFAAGVAQMSASDSTSLAVDFPLPLDGNLYSIYVQATVDPREDVVDFNPSNNVLIQGIRPNIFNVTPGAGSDTIQVAGPYRVYFPPGSVTDSSAVRVEIHETEPPRNQSALTPIPVQAPERFHALEVKLLNPQARLTGSFYLEVQLDTTLFPDHRLSVEDVKLYERTSPSRPWVFTPASVNPGTGKLVAAPRTDAWFAPFVTDDHQAPQIELTVDGRPLEGSGLVSPNPTLYVVVQDESGVDVDREKLTLLLDNQPVPPDKFFIPDSVQKSNVVGISVFPELKDGTHQLTVGVQDVNGISSQKNFQLVVAEGFDVKVYGNYPNPFKDQTIFSYFVELNDDLDEFVILIYTVSGRLIRKLDHDINNPLGAIDGGARRKGYNELIWDGRDDEGNEVANGVYFAVIRATYQGETIEKILKVAKLK